MALNAAVTHLWRVSVEEAKRIQLELADRVITHDDFGEVNTVAGIDVGFEDGNRTARAAVVVLSFPALKSIAHAVVRQPVEFPYLPGYLSFREIPAVLQALDRLERLPDLILCDGQGRAHPRRFGLASHLGVYIDRPTIGVGKTRLVGEYSEPGYQRGSSSPLVDGEEVIGVVLRTRTRVKPLFVSIGHRISLSSAIHYTLRCCTRYKLPETTRWAHRLASGPD
jgi:deoxyribonuclease V